MESVITQVVGGLTDLGHRVRVFQAIPPVYAEWAGTLREIYYYDPVCAGFPTRYPGEIDLIRWSLGYRGALELLGRPDVIVATHTPLYCLMARLAGSGVADVCPPILSWLHGPPSSYGGEHLLRYADAHLAISSGVAHDIEAIVQPESAVHTIFNPIDVSSVHRIKRPAGETHFLYVGRLDNTQKRLDLMFSALAIVRGPWRLDIIGDGPDMQNLQLMGKTMGISEKVHWHGWRDKPWNSVSSVSCLLLTSQYEGFGLVCVEALARGIPVVATECVGPAEIVQPGVNGWLVPVDDTDGLAQILQDIVSGSSELPDALACEKSVTRFLATEVVRNMEAIFINIGHTKYCGRKTQGEGDQL